MNTKRSQDGTEERLKIQETPLSNLADSLKRHEVEVEEEIGDIQAELKALKMFLTRSMPDFKKQFPEIHRKLK